MKKYISLFKIRFHAGIQYRAAALSGIVVQFIWGFLNIIFFRIVNTTSMTGSELTTYIWLNQAFISIFALWVQDTEIFRMIEEGGVAYEYVRPYDLYTMWFIRNLSFKFARCLLRAIPMIVITLLLPGEYGLSLPPSLYHFGMFCISIILASLLSSSLSMFMYIFTIFTKKSSGIRAAFIPVFDIFGGNIIPYPFFPLWAQEILKKTFFFGLQTGPLFLYLGKIDPLNTILMQFVWLIILISVGRILLRKAMKKVEIYGG